MTPSRFFDWFQLGALACLASLGLTRAVWLRARGVPIFAGDWQRTLWQMAADTFMMACLLAWRLPPDRVAAGDVVARRDASGGTFSHPALRRRLRGLLQARRALFLAAIETWAYDCLVALKCHADRQPSSTTRAHRA
jgi:hypothetical protein